MPAVANLGDTKPYHEVEAVPLGQRLSLQNWNAAQVREAIIPNVPTNAACWNCAHKFSWPPCRLPVKRDDRTEKGGHKGNLFYSYGVFCTWDCCKAYVLTTAGTQHKYIVDIALLANRHRKLHEGHKSSASNGITLRTLPKRSALRLFGGHMTIEEYRQGCIQLDGTVCGEDQIMTLLRPKQRRECYEAPAFIDKSIVTIVRCEVNNGQFSTCHSGMPTFNSGTNRNIRSCSSTNNTSTGNPAAAGNDMSIRQKMAESRRRKSSATAFSSGMTLDRVMGVVIKKPK